MSASPLMGARPGRGWGGRSQSLMPCHPLPDPGAPSLARPGFAVYVTRGGPGQVSAKALLDIGGLSRG